MQVNSSTYTPIVLAAVGGATYKLLRISTRWSRTACIATSSVPLLGYMLYVVFRSKAEKLFDRLPMDVRERLRIRETDIQNPEPQDPIAVLETKYFIAAVFNTNQKAVGVPAQFALSANKLRDPDILQQIIDWESAEFKRKIEN